MSLDPAAAARCATVGPPDAAPPAVSPGGLRLSEVVSALSYALDLTEGQPPGHSVRTALIGMRVARVLGLSDGDRSDLFYALVLKDLGCSANASRLAHLFGADDRVVKHVHKLTDWTRMPDTARYVFRQVLPQRGRLARAWHTLKLGLRADGEARAMMQTRCERGADIARMLGLSAATAGAIRALDEHWDGHGLPAGLCGAQIPLAGRVLCLAQTVEVFAGALGVPAAYGMARARRGTWFDPAVVDALAAVEDDAAFWHGIYGPHALAALAAEEPADALLLADEARLDQVCEAFARVIDAKSPYTARHSDGVAAIAVRLGAALQRPAADLQLLRRAGLLHDIGKLGVSSAILDKPARLTDDEMAEMRRHTAYTAEILERVGAFRSFAAIAAAHHERLDGTGYHRGLGGEHLGELARILAVADVCEALSAERPYRAALPRDAVLVIMRRLVGSALCPRVFEALECGVVEFRA